MSINEWEEVSLMLLIRPAQELKETLFRFPLAVLFGVLAAGLNIVVNHSVSISDMRIWSIGVFSSVLGIFLSILAEVVYERFWFNKGPKIKWTLHALIIAKVAGYFYVASRDAAFFDSDLFFRTVLGIMLISLCIIWIPTIQNKTLYFTESFRIWFKSIFVSILYVGILTIGLLLILTAWSTLISEVDGGYYMDVLAICGFVVLPIHLLSQQSYFTAPFTVGEGKMTPDTNKVLDIILTKLFMPIILIYTLVILVYLVLAIDDWMDIRIEYVMLSYLALGWMTLFLLQDIDRPLVKHFTWGYTVAVLIASLFQLYRSVTYSAVYGVTIGRYLIIVFCLVSVLAAVLYRKNIKWVPVLIATGLLISAVPPVDAITTSESSQKLIFNKIIRENPTLLYEDKLFLTEANVAELSETEVGQLRQSMEFMLQQGIIEEMDVIPSDFNEYEDLGLLYEAEGNGNDGKYYLSATLSEGMNPSVALNIDGNAEMVFLYADATGATNTFNAVGENFTTQIIDGTQLRIQEITSGEEMIFDLKPITEIGTMQNVNLTDEEAVFTQESTAKSYRGTLIVQNLTIWQNENASVLEGLGNFILIMKEIETE